MVAGGGLGGCVLAIAAARAGIRVVLIQNRPVLGGNASSEINVMLAGANAMDFNKDARESGILEEITVETAARSPDRSCRLFEEVLWEWVTRESNVELFLNMQLTGVEKDGPRRITAVHASDTISNQKLTVKADFFADCTGDAILAHEAGASWRMGREAKSEFGESLAPDQADHKVLGCTLPFQFKDTGKPVPFTPPAHARLFPDDASLPFRNHSKPESFWWVEWGGELDPIHQYQEIRDELTKVVYGLWDHLKNRGDHGVENYALLRVGPILGKRESRRIEGPYMLTQNDVMEQRRFHDAVAYGGWPIDLHPPEGIYHPGPPAEQIFVDPYEIPFRCLYSKDIDNLLMVGRDISVSHVALGTTRVMATIATMGQAVGTAIGLCVKKGCLPRDLQKEDFRGLQQALLRDDAYLIHQRNEDLDDLARTAVAEATSDAPLRLESWNDWKPLSSGCGQLFPVTAGRLDSVQLRLRNASHAARKVGYQLYASRHVFDLAAEKPLATGSVTVAATTEAWIDLPLNLPLDRGLYWIALDRVEGVSWARQLGVEPAGTKTAAWDAETEKWIAYRGEHNIDTAYWIPFRGCHAFRLVPDSRPHMPDQALNGVSRPVDWPNAWHSDPEQSLPQSLTLRFAHSAVLQSVILTFDTDLDSRVPRRFSSHVVRRYRLWARLGESETLVAEVAENYHRRCVHTLAGVTADGLRLEVLETHGDPSARVFEVRCYAALPQAR